MQFPLKLTAQFLKRSYARRMFRGWWKITIATVVAAVVVTADAMRGPLGITSIFVLCALGFYFVIAGVAWFRQSRALDEWLRQQAGAPLIYSLSEETIESTAEVGSTKLKWDAFRSLAISDFDTLLVFPHQGALTMPTDQIPREAIEFLKKQFLSHGKKIEDKRKKG
jgi:hypothetical protein